MDEKHHSFSRPVARVYGIHEAILLQYLAFRIKGIKKKYPSRDSVFVTIDEITEQYKYLKRSTVHGILKRLEEKGLVSSFVLNKKKYDRTRSYSIPKRELFKLVEVEPAYFSPDDAEKYGILAAVLIANLAYWVSYNRVTDPEYEWHWMSPYRLAGVLRQPRQSIAAALKKLEGKEIERRRISGTQDFEYRLLDPSRIKRWSDKAPFTSGTNRDLASPKLNVSSPKLDSSSHKSDVTSQKLDNNTYCKSPCKISFEEQFEKVLKDTPGQPSAVGGGFSKLQPHERTTEDKAIEVLVNAATETDQDGNAFFKMSDKVIVMTYNWFDLNKEFDPDDLIALMGNCHMTYESYYHDPNFEKNGSDDMLIRARDLHFFFRHVDKIMDIQRFDDWKSTRRFRFLTDSEFKRPMSNKVLKQIKQGVADRIPLYQAERQAFYEQLTRPVNKSTKSS